MTDLSLLHVGQSAPSFTLPDQSSTSQALASYKGKWVLLYFYPKDATPGCTTEACAFRDAWAELKEHDVHVFGVSADSVASHEKFAKAKKLPFPLLSDPEKQTIRAYGAWGEKKFMGRTYQGIHRVSYLISPAGKIAKVYGEVKPATHAAQVLADVQALSA